MNHPIPAAALDERLAFVGTSGSGKTYAAGTCVERILDAGQRAVILDPLGVWWGLRLHRDGRSAGYGVVIFGGAHGDLPLTENAGALIGETVAGMAEPAIVDLSQLGTKAAERRFALAFLTALYRHAPGAPLHLVLDEADMWAPQQIRDRDGDAARLLGMAETIVRRGRVKGFIPWLITQRPAVLNKDVLSQADGLVAMKLTATQDRSALKAWVEGAADAADLKRLNAELPGLPRGEAVIWLPSRGVYARAAFPQKRTFDSSAAPKRGEKRAAGALAPIDLGALKTRLAAVETEAKANDPKVLRAEIATLRRQMTEAAAQAARQGATPDPAALAAAEKRGYDRGRADATAAAQAAILELQHRQRQRSEDVAALHSGEMKQLAQTLAGNLKAPSIPSDPPAPSGDGRAAGGAGKPRRADAPAPPPVASGDVALGAERRPLQILVDRAPAAFTEPQWASLAGMKRTGGTWQTYKSRLKSAGMIEQDGAGRWRATPLALATLERQPPKGHPLDQWRAALGSGPAKIIDALEEHGPMTRDEIAAAVGMEARGGTFQTYLSRLKGNAVIEKDGDRYAISEVLR